MLNFLLRAICFCTTNYTSAHKLRAYVFPNLTRTHKMPLFTRKPRSVQTQPRLVQTQRFDSQHVKFCRIMKEVKRDTELYKAMCNLEPLISLMDETDKWTATGGGTNTPPSIDVITDLFTNYIGDDYDIVEEPKSIQDEMSVAMGSVDASAWCFMCQHKRCNVCLAQPPINPEKASKEFRQTVVSASRLSDYTADVNALVRTMRVCRNPVKAKELHLPVMPADTCEILVRKLTDAVDATEKCIERIYHIEKIYIGVCKQFKVPVTNSRASNARIVGLMRFMVLYPEHGDTDAQEWFKEHIALPKPNTTRSSIAICISISHYAIKAIATAFN